MNDRVRAAVPGGGAHDRPAPPEQSTPEQLLERVARGDRAAFDALYGVLAGPVLGLITRVMRDPAQAEEVAQEVLVEVWRKAATYSTSRGSAMGWAMTIAHRRAVDRVRAEQAASDRERRVGELADRPIDDVAEQAVATLERDRLRHCLAALTELQRESVTLAYYAGFTYREVAELLHAPLGTVKTRLRDGLIRLRDCLGVSR